MHSGRSVSAYLAIFPYQVPFSWHDFKDVIDMKGKVLWTLLLYTAIVCLGAGGKTITKMFTGNSCPKEINVYINIYIYMYIYTVISYSGMLGFPGRRQNSRLLTKK